MKGRRTMKMKRFLAILLVLAMCLTTLGVVPAMAVEPAAEESDDAISARWTDKDSLPPADQEITPHEVEGEIPSADGVDLSNDENALKASDIVTVIVELESEPLADAAGSAKPMTTARVRTSASSCFSFFFIRFPP